MIVLDKEVKTTEVNKLVNSIDLGSVPNFYQLGRLLEVVPAENCRLRVVKQDLGACVWIEDLDEGGHILHFKGSISLVAEPEVLEGMPRKGKDKGLILKSFWYSLDEWVECWHSSVKEPDAQTLIDVLSGVIDLP